MSTPLSGPGVGLSLPQSLFPAYLTNAPYDIASTQVCLNAGDQIPIPAGTWGIGLGLYCVLEWFDPLTATWKITASAAWQSGLIYIKSDGFNFRIANRTGCPVAGVVTAPGSSYVQATTSIAVTPSSQGSTWSQIVGGQLALVGGTLTSSGAGYGVAPICIIPPPPGPINNRNGVGGIPASGYCVISSGTVSGFTFTNPGAGYTTAPTAVIVPNPTDPNISVGITAATIAFSLAGSGQLTGVLCTNPGSPLATPDNITLTVSGAGSSGTVVPVMLQTVTAASVVGGSTIAAATLGALVTSFGGAYPTASFTNSPEFLGLAGRPRPCNISLTVGAAGTVAAQTGTIIDGGLFFKAPTPILNLLSTAASTGTIIGSSTLAFTMGSRADIVVRQPGPYEMATYSLANLAVTSTAFRGAVGAQQPLPINHPIEDDYVNTPAREQRAAMLGEPFLAKGPDGMQRLYKYDAERSIPGVQRVLVRVG